MAERVRYCTTEDGAKIAFVTSGEGIPFVWIPSSLQGGRSIWDTPLVKRWAHYFTVVRYDCRGLGASAPAVLDLSFEARLGDLDAVVKAVGGPVVLRAMNNACAVAIAYAATYPERVSALVLFGAYASGDALERVRPGIGSALTSLVKADANFGAKALATAISGQAEVAREMQGVTATLPDIVEALGRAFVQFDVTPLLSRVRVPTLAIHGPEDTMVPLKLGREVASGILGAQLYIYDGPHMPASQQTVDDVSRTVAEFLDIASMDRRSHKRAPSRPRSTSSSSPTSSDTLR